MGDVVVIKSGEVVEFPVAAGHPLAGYQKQVDVSAAGSLGDLAVVRAATQANPKLTTDQVTAAVKGILGSANVGSILQLTFPDIVVAEGATMVIGGPISTLNAGNVIVQGEILVHGSLNLKCATLGKISPPTVVGITPTSGSTLGGTEVDITGTGFTDDLQVFFGSTPATRVDSTSSALNGVCMAVAPAVANPGPVDVTVRTYGTFSSPSTTAAVFTYVYITGVAGIAVSPTILWSGETVTGTLTLDEPAPAGGLTIPLKATATAGVTVPASVAIKAGGTSATFNVTASASAVTGGVDISATGPDGTAHAVSFPVYAGQVHLAVVNIAETSLLVGGTLTGTVFVRTPAPASGGVVALSTNHPTAVSIPASVTVPAGKTSGSFTVKALHVTAPVTGIVVTATYEGTSSSCVPFAVIVKLPVVPPPPPPKGGGNQV